MGRPTVAILGASADRSKFGNRSLRAHLRAGFDVYPINPNVGEVEGIPTYPSLDDLPVSRLDRVSVYVQPEILVGLLDQIARMDVGEVWLNPGTDTPEVLDRAEELGIEVIRACSIVDVQSHPRRS